MTMEDFLLTLDPKTAKRAKLAAEVEIERLPLASRRLTAALGGGIARGRITTGFGNESAGKSMVFEQSMGLWQKQGLQCAYVDAEGTYDKAFGAKLGIDNSELLICQYKPFKRAMDEFLPWITGGIDVLVIDTVSALIPDAFLDDDDHIDIEKQKKMMAHAKSTADMLRAIHMENERTAVIILSQTTTSVQQTYVEQIPHGGKRLSFDSSQIIRFTSSASDANQLKGELQFGDRLIEKPIGREVTWFVKKNKLGRSHDTGKYNMYYAGDKIGIDREHEMITMLGDYGVLGTGSKGWFDLDGQKYRQKELAQMLLVDKDFEADMEKKLHVAMTGEIVE